MHIRSVAVVVLFAAGLTLGSLPTPVQANEPATATGLFELGLERFRAGELTEARDVFRRVDPMQLPRRSRVQLYETLQSIDRQLNAAALQDRPGAETPVAPAAPVLEPAPDATSEEVLLQAESLVTTQPAAAAALYRRVLADPEANNNAKSQATARLAALQRSLNDDLTSARRRIDQATQDILAGDLTAAQAKLLDVQGMGLTLGWFDQQRLERQLALVQQRLALEAAQPARPTRSPAQVVEEAQQPQAREQAAGLSPEKRDLLVEAQQLYAAEAATAARQAEVEGHYELAIRRWRDAAEHDPANAAYRESLSAAIAARNEQVAPRGPLETQQADDSLQLQKAVARYNEAMDTARRQARDTRYQAASDAAEQAKSILDQNRRFMTIDRYQQLRGDAMELASRINDAWETSRVEDVQREMAQRQAANEQERVRAADRQAQEVQDLLQRAQTLRRDMKYTEAVELVNQALFIEPTNFAAQFMKEMIEDQSLLVQFRENNRSKRLMSARQSVLTEEALIPYEELLTYPTEWPKLTWTRLQQLDESGGESEADRRTRRQLAEVYPINFEGNRLSNVIDFLRTTTRANFFVNWPALEAAGVEQDTPITLQLTNVPAEHALRLILHQAGAIGGADFDPIGYSIIEGVVTISTLRDLNRATDTRTYDIRDLLVQVKSFKGPRFDLSSSSGSGSGGSGGGGLFSDDDEDEEDEDQMTRGELVESIVELIRETVGEPGQWIERQSTVVELNSNLIIKTTHDNHRQVVSLLSQLRETRATQISVEARFLLVAQNFLDEFGVDIDMQYKPSSSRWSNVQLGQDSISNTEVSGESSNSPVGNALGTLLNSAGQFAGMAPTGRALDFGVSFLDDLEVSLLVRATQTNRRAVSLTAPRITFFNGQQAYISVTREVRYISELEAVPDAGGFTPETEIIEEGVILDVEGTVSADRRYVTMTVQPSLATLVRPMRFYDQVGTSTTTTGSGSDTDTDRVRFTGRIELPEREITRLAATVSVPDRGTLLLGGQRLVRESEVESGVPVLSKMPVINRLFSNRSTTKEEQTLLILIKPTIIIQSELEEENFPGLLDNPAKYNVGRQF